jgi:hypothetical protein
MPPAVKKKKNMCLPGGTLEQMRADLTHTHKHTQKKTTIQK